MFSLLLRIFSQLVEFDLLDISIFDDLLRYVYPLIDFSSSPLIDFNNLPFIKLFICLQPLDLFTLVGPHTFQITQILLEVHEPIPQFPVFFFNCIQIPNILHIIIVWFFHLIDLWLFTFTFTFVPMDLLFKVFDVIVTVFIINFFSFALRSIVTVTFDLFESVFI